MDKHSIQSAPFGVVGLGLMGSSIVVALLVSGHRVIGVAPIPGEREKSLHYLKDLLSHAEKAGLLTNDKDSYFANVEIVEDYVSLQHCKLVLECVIENLDIKQQVYQRIAQVVSTDTIIASNTSAIPISQLQKLVPEPSRFLGIHWAEPAYMTRFLEVTCGSETNPLVAECVASLALEWDKEPTILNKDIRGFITNRLMYTIYREALTLVEEGHTTIGDLDKSCRYDMGSWMTIMGIFRRMDYIGVEYHLKSYQELFPQLSNRTDVPVDMKNIADKNGRGIHNLDGWYDYNHAEAKEWEEAFADFNEKLYHLAADFHTKRMELVR